MDHSDGHLHDCLNLQESQIESIAKSLAKQIEIISSKLDSVAHIMQNIAVQQHARMARLDTEVHSKQLVAYGIAGTE